MGENCKYQKIIFVRTLNKVNKPQLFLVDNEIIDIWLLFNMNDADSLILNDKNS